MIEGGLGGAAEMGNSNGDLEKSKGTSWRRWDFILLLFYQDLKSLEEYKQGHSRQGDHIGRNSQGTGKQG